MSLNWSQRSSLCYETSENLWTYSLNSTKSLAVSRTSQQAVQAGTALAGSLHLLPSQVWFGTSCAAVQLEYFLLLSPDVVHQILLLQVYRVANKLGVNNNTNFISTSNLQTSEMNTKGQVRSTKALTFSLS